MYRILMELFEIFAPLALGAGLLVLTRTYPRNFVLGVVLGVIVPMAVAAAALYALIIGEMRLYKVLITVVGMAFAAYTTIRRLNAP